MAFLQFKLLFPSQWNTPTQVSSSPFGGVKRDFGKMIKIGTWCNSEMKNRKVEIRWRDKVEQEGFSVWYESDQEPFSVFGGRFENIYDAEHSVEVIVGRKIEWQIPI